jgi:arsenate reductase
MPPKKVLILCTGNSCRSQMAEGLVNHFLGRHWQAYSAGTQPAGYVHPFAVHAMAQLGIDISRHRSKSVDEFKEMAFDAVITVCDDAAENCPVWLGRGKKAHLGFIDPAAALGSEQERLHTFRQVRDEISRQLLTYLAEPAPGQTTSPPKG